MDFITEETRQYLSGVYRDELRNSYMYGYVSMFLAKENLNNFSKFFKYRAQEELKHAEMMREFCEEKNIIFDFGADIQGFDQTLENINDFCEFAYNVEIETNKRWEIFYDMCYSPENSRLMVVLGDMFIKEQSEEMSWALMLMGLSENLGDNKGAWQKFDKGFDPKSYGNGIYGDGDD